MEEFYECSYCSEKWPVIGLDRRPKPKKLFMDPIKKIGTRRVEIGIVKTACHKCTRNIVRKVKTIAAKERGKKKQIGAVEMRRMKSDAGQKAIPQFGIPGDHNPDWEKHRDRILEGMIGEKYGIAECFLCYTRYESFQGNLHTTADLAIAQRPVATIVNYCNNCFSEITKEIKKII